MLKAMPSGCAALRIALVLVAEALALAIDLYGALRHQRPRQLQALRHDDRTVGVEAVDVLDGGAEFAAPQQRIALAAVVTGKRQRTHVRQVAADEFDVAGESVGRYDQRRTADVDHLAAALHAHPAHALIGIDVEVHDPRTRLQAHSARRQGAIQRRQQRGAAPLRQCVHARHVMARRNAVDQFEAQAAGRLEPLQCLRRGA